jgi:hypothetical protein
MTGRATATMTGRATATMTGRATTTGRATMGDRRQSPPPGAARGMTGTPRWRRLVRSAQARILAWYVVLLAFGLTASILVERQVLLTRLASGSRRISGRRPTSCGS